MPICLQLALGECHFPCLKQVIQFSCELLMQYEVFACRYTVTGSLSLVAVKRSICFHRYHEDSNAPCSYANIPWMIFFGALQLL